MPATAATRDVDKCSKVRDVFPPSVTIAVLTFLAVMLIMGGEALLSAFNERALRARGAIEPDDDVYPIMRWAYPLSFLAMAIEGALLGPAPPNTLVTGLAIFGCAKALKISVFSSLGWRWSFRVLVLPDAPLVTTGPYRLMRHPNYLAVMGELLGMALIVLAPITGTIGLIGFAALLARRIRVEDRALGRQ
jgi:methyltransferase